MTPKQTKNDNAIQAVASNPLAIPISIVIAGIFIALAIIFSDSGNGAGPATNKEDGLEPSGISNEERLELVAMQPDDYVLGNRNAEIYILEFSDTECPFCKRFHATMHEIVDIYDGKVAWVYRHFPLVQLHSKASKEAEALECAGELGGNDIFWEYTDALYKATPSNNGLDLSELPEIAVQVGLDRTEFETCLSSGKYAKEVQKDLDNAIALGGRGTPHSLIVFGDKIIPINGAQPINVVRASIDSLLNN